VTVGQNKNIFILCVHVETGVMFHHFEEQSGKKISTAKGTTGMAATCTVYHTNNIAPDLGSNGLKFCHKN
jgi:hypothetical protein